MIKIRGNRGRSGSLVAVVCGASFLLTACGGGGDEAPASVSPTPSPSPTVSSTEPLLGGDGEPLVVVPTPTTPADGVAPVRTNSLILSWTASQGTGGYEEQWPLGLVQGGATSYVTAELPEGATFAEANVFANAVQGQNPAPSVTVVVVDQPSDTTCNEGLIAGTAKKDRIVSVENEERTADVGTGKPSGRKVCIGVTAPTADFFSDATAVLALSWETPELDNPNEWWVTSFQATGAPVQVN